MSGNSRDGHDGRPVRKAGPLRPSPEPASRRPSRGRLHGTQLIAVSPQIVERRWSEVSGLFTTDKVDPGEQTTRPLVCNRRNPRLHHLELQNSPLFPTQELQGGWKQKPLRSVGSGGVRETELWKGPQAIPPPRESARVSPHRSNDPSVFCGLVMTSAARIIVSLATR